MKLTPSISRHSSFRRLLSCLALLLLGVSVLGYLGYLAGRPDLGVTTESVSLARSLADGLYVGDYVPDQSSVTLPDGTRVEFATAWAEHVWKPRLAWLFFERKEVVARYHLFMPLTSSRHLETTWSFPFALRLAPADAHLTSSPGIGFSPATGMHISLDGLPAQVHFEVHQKRIPQSD